MSHTDKTFDAKFPRTVAIAEPIHAIDIGDTYRIKPPQGVLLGGERFTYESDPVPVRIAPISHGYMYYNDTCGVAVLQDGQGRIIAELPMKRAYPAAKPNPLPGLSDLSPAEIVAENARLGARAAKPYELRFFVSGGTSAPSPHEFLVDAENAMAYARQHGAYEKVTPETDRGPGLVSRWFPASRITRMEIHRIG